MIVIGDGVVILNVDECPNCGSRNIFKKDGSVICLDCGENFADVYEFENPRDCDHCGYYGDCLERFRFCPFDGRDANEKLMESWRKE